MLQQTQVDRVIPRWFDFLETYPTPEACAAVPLGEVLRLWQGLGYPRRARNLHAAARRVAELGSFPRTLDGLLALPGVGQYTARALLAFAFEDDAAVVDTNIARVLARCAGRRLTAREVQAVADASLASDESWSWNQSIMDLGATLCRPMAPRCSECPLLLDCVWHGGAGEDPAVGSANVSGRQARFDGSDRQGRGRLMKAMGDAPVPAERLAIVMGWPDQPDRAARVAAHVVADGLSSFDGVLYRLPD